MYFFLLLAFLWGLHWFLRRREKARRATLLPVTSEVQIAVHEAGHAIAAHRCTRVPELLEIKIWEEDGRMRGQAAHVMSYTTDDSRWCLLVIMLSGIAAEEHLIGDAEWRTGASDLMHALKLAEYLVDVGFKAPRTVDCGVQVERAFTQPLFLPVQSILQSGLNEAFSLVERSVPQITRLTGLLLMCKVVSGGAIDRCVGSRVVQKRLGQWMGRSFV